jgi:predicted DNA-binding transcriptional regulator AlpA
MTGTVGTVGTVAPPQPTVAARPADDRRLFTAEVAVLVGVQEATIRQHLRRGTIPPPDGRSGRRWWWKTSSIERWIEIRRKPGNPEFGQLRRA